MALGLLYIQLTDYDKITNSLLSENSSSYENIEKLNNKIILLEKIKIEQINKIISLENNNTNLTNQIIILENNNSTLNNKITQLQDEIILIDENISIVNLPPQQYIPIDINNTINNSFNLNEEILSSKDNITVEKEEENILIEPKVTLDEQNKITSFGIEYKEKF